MEFVEQKLEDILGSLKPLSVEWKDDTARRVIERLTALPIRDTYNVDDVRALLDSGFDDGILVCRLFLGLSKDQFHGVLSEARPGRGVGVSAYRADKEGFLDTVVKTGLLETMALEINRKPHWSDVLVERLRSGRGSAIAGQKRGRSVEDFVEDVVKSVFGSNFKLRCTFTGARKQIAKCDIAIPSKTEPRILIEAKGYGATGSKMSDVLGDLRAIIAAKRSDTALLFFTDGLTWKQRQSDLRKIVEFQNNGDITRIYTFAMAKQFESDLKTLKREYRI